MMHTSLKSENLRPTPSIFLLRQPRIPRVRALSLSLSLSLSPLSLSLSLSLLRITCVGSIDVQQRAVLFLSHPSRRALEPRTPPYSLSWSFLSPSTSPSLSQPRTVWRFMWQGPRTRSLSARVLLSRAGTYTSARDQHTHPWYFCLRVAGLLKRMCSHCDPRALALASNIVSRLRV